MPSSQGSCSALGKKTVQKYQDYWFVFTEELEQGVEDSGSESDSENSSASGFDSE
jgi:hypothetical protein